MPRKKAYAALLSFLSLSFSACCQHRVFPGPTSSDPTLCRGRYFSVPLHAPTHGKSYRRGTGARLPFSDVTLCSVLTCLLDSAYHLATQCTPPQVPIHFSAQLTDKALTLSCQAPSLSETPQESNPFSAMELSILQETVSQLHGTLEVQQKNNSAQLHVVLPQANEKITA